MKSVFSVLFRGGAGLAALVFPLLASAHPGHDHSDIPAVIRHPFSGWDHVLILALVLAGAGAALVIGARAFRATPALRWLGVGMIAAGVVALGLA